MFVPAITLNKNTEIMKASFLQLNFIENLEKNFKINYIDYGFLSNGDISVLCKDEFGEFAICVNKNGITT